MIIACLGMKGGCGKTTLATNLAAGLAAQSDKRALLLDTDEQASAARWNLERPERRPLVKTLQLPDAKQLKNQFYEFEEKFHYVIIDGSPRVDQLSTVTLGIADLVLLPIQPSPLDIWGTERLAERVHKVKKVKPDFRAIFVLSRYNPATLLSRSASSAIQTLGIPLLKAAMGQRVAYAEAVTQGLSVLEYSDPKADSEMREILTSVLAIERGEEPSLATAELDSISEEHKIT